MKKLTPLALGLSLALFGMAGCADTANMQLNTATAAIDANQAASDAKVFNTPYLSKTLANGLTVVVIKTDYPDVVSMQIPVSTGSRNEVEAGKTGFAHFFEHMMFKGTKNHPQEVYDKILKNAGVDNRAFTTNDWTNYHSVFSNDHLDTMIKLEADRFANLSYTDDQFRTEALTVKGEYLKNASNPIRQLLEGISKLAYTQHTYKHTTMGFFEDIEKMPEQLAYGKLFFERWYGPQNTGIVIAGDVDPAKTVALVEKYWGGWQRGDYQAEIPVEPPQQGSKYQHMVKPQQPNNYLVTGYHGPAFEVDKKDFAAVSLLGELYFGDSSPLYQSLVNDKKLANQLFTYFPEKKDPGLLMLFARSDKADNLATIRDAFTDTLAQARTELIDDTKLNDLKNNLKYSFASGLDSSRGIARMMSGYLHYNHDPEAVNKYYRSLAAVTAEDIRDAANRYFVDSNRTTLTMNNAKQVDGFNKEVSIDERVAALKQASSTVTPVNVLDMRNSSSIIDINWLFNTGAAADPEGKKGLAALMSMMLSEGGSAHRSYSELQQLTYPLAGSFSAQLDKEMLSFRGRIHKDNLDAWYPLVMEQLLEPGWREDDLERLRTDLINAIETGLKASNDEELGKEVLYAKLYQDHVYGSLNLGDISDINSITLDDLKAFYKAQLTLGRLTLGITGDMSDEMLAKVKSSLSVLPAGKTGKMMVSDAPKLQGRHVTIVEKEGLQSTAVSFGFPMELTRSDEDWVAMWLVRSWLGQHRSHNSYLYQRIRQIRGMNYGDYSYIEYFPRGMFRTQPNANLGRSEQIFQIWLRPLRDNQDAHFATRVAMMELDKLINKGLTPEQFEATRNFLKNYVVQLLASQDRQLGYALDSQFYGTDNFVDMVRQGLKTLTVEQVNAAVKRHLSTDNIQYVFISGDAKDMQQRLETEQSSPMSYNADKPAELLAEDKVIAELPLKINSVEVLPLERVFK